MEIFKKSRNLADLQKELVKNGELVNETTTETPSENKFGNLMTSNNIKVIASFMLNNRQYDFKLYDYPILIEIDGAIHNEMERRQKDYVKDRYATSKGYRVIRFTNNEIEREQSMVLQSVREVMKGMSKSPRIAYVYPLSIKEQIQYWYYKKFHRGEKFTKTFQYFKELKEQKVKK